MLKFTPNLEFLLVYGYIKLYFTFITHWVLDPETGNLIEIYYVDRQQFTWTYIHVPKGTEPRDLSMKDTLSGVFKHLNLIFQKYK